MVIDSADVATIKTQAWPGAEHVFVGSVRGAERESWEGRWVNTDGRETGPEGKLRDVHVQQIAGRKIGVFQGGRQRFTSNSGVPAVVHGCETTFVAVA